jgi:hypothetical protein
VLAQVRDAAGNYIEPYSFRFSTGGGLNASAPPVFTSFTASSYQPAPNQNISVNATATGTGTLEYRFNFDGTWSAWSGSATANHSYLSAGRPRVLAQVRDAAGNIVTNSLRLLVITATTGPLPTQSSTLAIGDDAGEDALDLRFLSDIKVIEAEVRVFPMRGLQRIGPMPGQIRRNHARAFGQHPPHIGGPQNAA